MSELHRWQAGMGVIAGAFTADAVARGADAWSTGAMAMADIAESTMAGHPLPIDLAPTDSAAVAVGLADSTPPLLIDMATVELLDAVRVALDSGRCPNLADPRLSDALDRARSGTFLDAIARCENDVALARLVGLFLGLEGGLGAIPARLVSTLRAPDGRRGRRWLCGLTNRLLGIERPNWYDPRSRRGPKEVLPGVWLSNLYGLASFTAAHPDGLVLSLCDEEGRIRNHPHHITFHLEDTPRTDANPSLELVVDEVLNEVRSARKRGQPALVHCRHGASRTGLILRLLLVDELGLSADDALTEAQCLWPHTSTWNTDWTREVERRAIR